MLYAGAVYPPKNFTRMVQAYARVGPARGISLVIAGGENRFLSEARARGTGAPAGSAIGSSGPGGWTHRPSRPSTKWRRRC